MKGYELQEAIKREVVKKGTAGSEIRIIDEHGYIYDIVDVEAEVLPDGKHVTWIKTREADDEELGYNEGAQAQGYEGDG